MPTAATFPAPLHVAEDLFESVIADRLPGSTPSRISLFVYALGAGRFGIGQPGLRRADETSRNLSAAPLGEGADDPIRLSPGQVHRTGRQLAISGDVEERWQ